MSSGALGVGVQRTGVPSEIGVRALRLDGPLGYAIAGSVLAAALAAPAQATPTIESLSVQPSYFTPNGDGRTDSTEVSFIPGGAADSVTVRVQVRRVSDETLMATPLPASRLSVDSTVTRGWDPGPIADGAYRFDVLVVDGADSLQASAIVVADTVPPIVSFGAVAPNPYDPASAPPNNILLVPVTVVSDTTTATTVRIHNDAGALTDSLGTLHGAGTNQLTWDGKNAAGVAALTGHYFIRAISADLAGHADTATVAFTLDREAPTISLFNADSSGTLQTNVLPVTLAGKARDFDRVVAMTVSVDSNGVTYVPVDSLSAPDSSVSWFTSVTYPGPPARHHLRLRAQDAVGHVAERLFTVAYDDTFPVAISETVLGGGHVTDGDTLRIRSVWSLSDLILSARLSPLDSGWELGDEDVLEGPPGTYLITYRVTPTNSVLPASKRIAITASTGIVAVVDSVTVELLDEAPRPDELVLVNRNRFDPDSGDHVTIAATTASAPVKVQIYNLAGDRVRLLEGRGYVDWDGRGEGGVVCGSGVYFLHVQANGGTEVRRVAILRGSGP